MDPNKKLKVYRSNWNRVELKQIVIYDNYDHNRVIHEF